MSDSVRKVLTCCKSPEIPVNSPKVLFWLAAPLSGIMRAMEISHSQTERRTDVSLLQAFDLALSDRDGIGFQQRLLTSINGDAPSGSFRLAQSVVREQEVIIPEAALIVVLSVCPFVFAC
ncbi:MAG: hypothetical protein AB7U82_31110 [Blastocatellales bacterium]